MTRATVADVRLIVKTSLPDAAVQAFIDAASGVIDRYATQCSLAGAGALKTLEAWLSAHFIAMADTAAGGLASRSFGTSSENYRSAAMGSGLSSTSYGQMLLTLDPCGILSRISDKPASVVLL